MQARMTEERIRELLTTFLAPASLSTNQIELVLDYLDLLLKWNSKVNLTAVREPEEIVSRHFGESLFAARHLFPDRDSATTAIDIGSGAGFPGLPLKIWSSALDLTLIEANQKKAVFLREVIRTLGLTQVSVLAQRAETVNAMAELVSLRAVERFEKTLPIAQQLLKARGRIALLIGSGQTETARSLLPDIRWDDPIPIPLSHSRILLVGESE
jgi:16S rRNA (guanine527-N7)-methyltransferase